MPDRINTAMKRVEDAGGHATRNTDWGEAG
jgi:hypothetical protein